MADKEQARLVMRELWERSDTYLREHADMSERFPRTETPGGVEITRIGDGLEVSAGFLKYIGNRACDVTLRIEFPPDIRELPQVFEDWSDDEGSGTSTIAHNDFPRVAQEITELFEPMDVTT